MVLGVACRAGVVTLLRACERAHPLIRVQVAPVWTDVSAHTHDVLVVDLGTGASAIGLLSGEAPAPPRGGVLLVSCCPDQLTAGQVEAFVRRGVTGIVDLVASVEDLATAIHDVARRAVSMRFRSRRPCHLDRVRLADASPRDLALLRLIARGLTDREIGGMLHMSEHTVKHHIERLRERLGSRNRIELAALAGAHGLHTPAESEA